MTDLLPPWPSLLAFLAAAVVLAVTPGPGVVFIVARTLAQGRAHGLASVAGVALGNFMNAAAASIGLAAVLAASSTAFEALRWAGAAYLAWLGIQAWRERPAGGTGGTAEPGRWQVVGQGWLVALLNPKTTLFFAAFLPQFMRPDAAPVAQALALGGLFVGVAAVSDSIYVLLASSVSGRVRVLSTTPRAARRVTAAIYMALGLYAAISNTRPAPP